MQKLLFGFRSDAPEVATVIRDIWMPWPTSLSLYW